ncbi:protein pangolin, isoforms A/H/I/S-like [Musca domestica]|uniref:dTCF n=1 Tax=Musca domestica TaxID=7370 RepID=A0A1I8N8M7_MUSDO|nr:protein pangolin, isoforms A/H/I/S-like [Musca domestica]XP_058980890.1 protein pangolin, isoforms A/H/I/S-like [Musca domestica]
MSHTNHARHATSSGDDLGSTDEVKVFKDEGDREDEKISSENLLEEKSSLIDLTESEEKSGKITTTSGQSPVFNKIEPHTSTYNMGYLVSPYSYSNGSAASLPVTMANKIGLPCFLSHNGDHLNTPPPAHCGIPPYQIDAKSINLGRPAIYPFPSSQYPYSMISPDMSQVTTWHTPSVYSAASSFRSPYPSSLPINSALPSDFTFRFSPNLLPSVHTPQHHMIGTHSTITPTGPKQDNSNGTLVNQRFTKNVDSKNSKNTHGHEINKDNYSEKKKPHIKKPLNAFMLYMKEMRSKVVAECTLKESAAINQILGRRWHELSREEQSKYYEKARQERQLHMELYPGWSARDNYGYVSKKKKRKKDRSPADSGANNMKKCRARFGLDQQNQWCKPCKRKKKCIRYMESIGVNYNSVKEEQYDLDDLDGQRSDDDDIDNENIGSCDSADDNTKTYDEDNESLNQSMSSPSGFSSFQSPPTSLSSPAIVQNADTLISVSEQNHNNSNLHSIQTQNLHITSQSKIQQHFQPSTSMSSLCPQQNSVYEIAGSTQSSISNFISTITSTSPSSTKSMSSYSTATTSTTIPASLSDRMMRSLLTSSPAMLLGNRLSHLAMGLAMNNNCSNAIGTATSNITSEKVFNILDKTGRTEVGTAPLTSNKCSITSNAVLQGDSDKVDSSTPSAIVHPTKSPLVPTCLPLPATSVTEQCHLINTKTNSIIAPLQRSPVGANPRDVNNPLSVNQLTKRSHDDIVPDVSNCNTNINVSQLPKQECHILQSGTMGFQHTHSTQHIQPSLTLPPPSHSAIFNNSFSQHFQHKFNQNLVATIVDSETNSSVSSVVTHTVDKSHNSINNDNDVSRNPSTDRTTNESGAINVT